MRTVAELHPEPALHDQKQFVFMIVMVEDEFSFDLVQLYMLSVELGGNVGLPVFGDLGELLSDIDFVHASPIVGMERKSQRISCSPGRIRPGLREAQ
jgi:hypothetical protein